MGNTFGRINSASNSVNTRRFSSSVDPSYTNSIRPKTSVATAIEDQAVVSEKITIDKTIELLKRENTYLKDRFTCCVSGCTNKIAILALPCGHAVLCKDHEKPVNICPVDGVKILATVNIYMA